MILTIIFTVMFIATIVTIIICEKKDILDDDHLGMTIPIVISSLISFIGFGACLIILVNENVSIHKKELRNKLEQIVASLNATKTMIMQNFSDNSIIEITNYNTKVAEFKEDILNQKARRENVWISWFTSPVYDDYTGNEVEYIEA